MPAESLPVGAISGEQTKQLVLWRNSVNDAARLQITDKIRRICARLIDTPPDSAMAAMYRAELKAATVLLAAQENGRDKGSERDSHQDAPRQSYRSREKDSANGFAEGLKLFNPKKPDSEKKKD